MDLISVVVVTYNSSTTVVETLESIYNQTYPMLELIVSDDHSTDDTISIVKKWVKKNADRFCNVRILVGKHNHGVTKNCNIGIHNANGKYVQLIAGDDILLKDLIEKKYNFARKNQLNYVVSRVEPFGENEILVNDMISFCEKGYDIIKAGWEEQYENILFSNYIAGPSGGFYLKQFFLEFGSYDTRYKMLEDYPFIYKYIVSGNEIVLLDEVLARYRITGQSLCTSNNTHFNNSQMKFFFQVRIWELLRNRKYLFVLRQIASYMLCYLKIAIRYISK